MLQLSQQVLVELVELRQVVEDLVEETLLDHWLPVVTRRCGHGVAEVLQGPENKVGKKEHEGSTGMDLQLN